MHNDLDLRIALKLTGTELCTALFVERLSFCLTFRVFASV